MRQPLCHVRRGARSSVKRAIRCDSPPAFRTQADTDYPDTSESRTIPEEVRFASRALKVFGK